ncbi:MAG: S8 family serine peptidase [Cyanobacteria bacterium J06592_8]
MFETQEFTGLHLSDTVIGNTRALDAIADPISSFQSGGDSNSLILSTSEVSLHEPVELTNIATNIAEIPDSHLENQQHSPTIDPLTGINLSTDSPVANTFFLSDDTLNTAQDLGVLEGTQTVNDSVGISDLDDYYRIHLNATSNVNLSLEGLSADADLELIADRNGDGFADYGEVIDWSLNWGTESDYISAVNLPAGTYFVNVEQYSGFTPYTLTLSATPTVVDPVLVDPVLVDPVSSFDPVQGYGLVNASAAVSRAVGSPVPFADIPDTYHPNWGLNTIHAPEVWSQGYTGEGVVVAVLDTGVDYTHPDLNDRIWRNIDEIENNGIDDDGNGYVDDIVGWDFYYNDADPMDFHDHGTHVAGIIAAEGNEFGVTGVAPNAQIMPVQVMDEMGYSTPSTVASGIYYAVANGADVINMSLGFSDFYYDLTPLQQAVQFAADNGVVVVSAAGNEYWSSPIHPAQYATDWGIAVGASDSYNFVANFSNDAGWTPLDYVVAPGVDVYSTTSYNGYQSLQGTSMAAPHVSGVAALILSANPNLTPPEVEQILTETANPNILIA